VAGTTDAPLRAETETTRSCDQQAPGQRAILDPKSITDLAELARLIREYQAQGLVAYRTSLEHAVMVGKLLLRAKQLLPHGEFTAWRKANCPRIGEGTARAYMRVAKADKLAARAIDPKRQSAAVLTLTDALKQLAKRPSASGDKKPSETATQPRETEADPDEESTDDEQDADGSDHDEEERPETRRNRSEAASKRHETGQADQEGSEAEAAEDGSDNEAEEADEEIDKDAAWLASLRIRAQLSDTIVFDEQAKLWRRLQPLMEQMRDAHEPAAEELSRAWSCTVYKKRYSYLVAVLLGANPPQDWVPCPRCKGSGKSGALKTACFECEGACFAITHRGDPMAHQPEVARPVIETI
jgi:hypothetical protein